MNSGAVAGPGGSCGRALPQSSEQAGWFGSRRRRGPVFAHASASHPQDGRNWRGKKTKSPGFFEVEDISPPPRSLGVYPLPMNTHNGDVISVQGEDFIVQSVVLQYKLVRGRYRPKHRRLEVRGTGRYFANEFLENVYKLDISSR